MQVSEVAANEWARENKIAGFNPDQLFEPKTNLEAAPGICIAPWNTGTISPIQLLSPWRNTTPAPARAQRWSGGNGVAEIPERQFLQKIDFPQRADTSSRLSTATNSISARRM
jgi:hypothetical protein